MLIFMGVSFKSKIRLNIVLFVDYFTTKSTTFIFKMTFKLFSDFLCINGNMMVNNASGSILGHIGNLVLTCT